ncbi:fibronectin type III domain-containing protein [Lentzea sp. NEAU-D13]|uniref:Fibronectin type III domain-containing protein n=1 Tax=Lentzea alba TaxID=2714351 RepID=A0A7C9RTU6_9PSEU|nr:fibronectin type III domain-containing protein [Lentzea alba]NGY60562.1 fibronectin type III domain-containing protein [Lentzea alba]
MLTSELTSPTDVTLHWRPEAGAAGQVVEYANAADGDYVVLEFAPPGRDSYRHPDLIPETRFYYRVRPFTGPASATVDVALPPGDEVPEIEGPDWTAARKGGGGTRPVSSPEAAPGNLKAEVKHANGILFTWEDHAADEDGYLIEVKPAGAADYRVAVQLDPDSTSYGVITLPDEKTATYRVRAFRFGSPSNLTHQTTGKA